MTDAPDYAGIRTQLERGQWVKPERVLALLADHDSLREDAEKCDAIHHRDLSRIEQAHGDAASAQAHHLEALERVEIAEAELDSLQTRLDTAERDAQSKWEAIAKVRVDVAVAARDTRLTAELNAERAAREASEELWRDAMARLDAAEKATEKAKLALWFCESELDDERKWRAAAEEQIASLQAENEHLQAIVDGIPDAVVQAALIGAKHALPVPQPSEEQADRCPTVNSLSGSRCVRDVLHLGAHVWEASRG